MQLLLLLHVLLLLVLVVVLVLELVLRVYATCPFSSCSTYAVARAIEVAIEGAIEMAIDGAIEGAIVGPTEGTIEECAINENLTTGSLCTSYGPPMDPDALLLSWVSF